MPAVLDIAYGALGFSVVQDIRPPVGEIWHITNFEQDDASAWPKPRYSTGTGSTYHNVSLTNAVGGMWIDNATWCTLVNTTATSDYCAHILKYQMTDISIRVANLVLNSDGVTPATGEFRPPVGTDWMCKALLAAKDVGMMFKDGTTTTTPTVAIALGGDVVLPSFKYGAAVSFPMTNLFWMRVTTLQTGPFAVVLTYAEVAPGSLDWKTGFATLAPGGFADVRAPLGEIWMIGAWAGGTELDPYDGTTRNTGTSNLWPRLKAMKPVGNAKWLQIAAASASTVAYAGWRHPL